MYLVILDVNAYINVRVVIGYAVFHYGVCFALFLSTLNCTRIPQLRVDSPSQGIVTRGFIVTRYSTSMLTRYG